MVLSFLYLVSFLLVPDLHFLTLLPHLGHEGQEPTPGCYSLYLQYRAPKHKQEQRQLSSDKLSRTRLQGTKEELLSQHHFHLEAPPDNDISPEGTVVLTSMIGTKSKIINTLKTVHGTGVNTWDTFCVSKGCSVSLHLTRGSCKKQNIEKKTEIFFMTSCQTAFLCFTCQTSECNQMFMWADSVALIGLFIYNDYTLQKLPYN